MNGFINGILITLIAVLIVSAAFIIGEDVAQMETMKDCALFGKVEINGDLYQCRKVQEAQK